MKKYGEKAEQLKRSMVKEWMNQKHVPAKLVDIVSMGLFCLRIKQPADRQNDDRLKKVLRVVVRCLGK